MIPSIVETLVAPATSFPCCYGRSITWTQTLLCEEREHAEQAQAAQRVAAHKRAGLLAAVDLDGVWN